jgi:hypothetical protein
MCRRDLFLVRLPQPFQALLHSAPKHLAPRAAGYVAFRLAGIGRRSIARHIKSDSFFPFLAVHKWLRK